MNEIAFTQIEGGVCAAKGFRAAGIHSGLRKNKERLDLALILADCDCNAAGVFTTNKVFAAPVGVTRSHLKNGSARAIICNSGNANACNFDGYDKANRICEITANAIKVQPSDVLIGSTGVIGVPLPVEPFENSIDELVSSLEASAKASDNAANAIMTTDTKKKEFAYSFTVDGKEVRIGGICKGSGMIHPNMATMLGFITTDAAISSEMLKKALSEVISDTFNMVSVDGDTSTNDTVVVMASGLAGNRKIDTDGTNYGIFKAALYKICHSLCTAIAADGEGATKLLECRIRNFGNKQGAKILAKSVIGSSLVKCAIFGSDANWGRILCALGYAGVEIDVDKIDVKFISNAGELPVCKNGRGVEFSEETAKKILLEKEIVIDVDMNDGNANATAWGCDLSYEYVHINGDYRS